jgi:hypothetical protein
MDTTDAFFPVLLVTPERVGMGFDLMVYIGYEGEEKVIVRRTCF